MPLTPVSETAIAAACPEAGLSIRLYDALDSTNTQARRMVLAGDRPTLSRPTLIVARTQTAGRGRLGRSFFSPPDSGLYMTLVYPLIDTPAASVGVTAAAAVATCGAIRAVTGLCPGIKWVNDLYLGGKKICGILTEAVSPAEPSGTTYVLVGIGVNLTTAAFPEGMRAPAGCLTEFLTPETMPTLDAGGLCGSIAGRLWRIIRSGRLYHPDTLAEYRSLSLLIGREVNCVRGAEIFSGRVLGISDNYGLLLRHTNGTIEEIISGEVSVCYDASRERENPS